MPEYFHLIDPHDQFETWNLRAYRGQIWSAAYTRRNTDQHDARSPYERLNAQQDKELVFEEVRTVHFPLLPSRLGSLFLFVSRETAARMNSAWWSGKRVVCRAEVIEYESEPVAHDASLLNCRRNDWYSNAKFYWSGRRTEDPIIEVLVDGFVYIPGWLELLALTRRN